jgi:putative two-component system response regulator
MHFDSDMLDAFLDIQEEFRSIALRFIDSDADMKEKKAISSKLLRYK